MRIALVLVFLLLAGCMGKPPPGPGPCAPAVAFPYRALEAGANGQATDPRYEYHGLAWRPDSTGGALDPEAPRGWTVNAVEELSPDPANASFLRVAAKPATDPAMGNLTLDIVDSRGRDECRRDLDHRLDWKMAEPTEGEVAAPGQGVLVETAGFWLNGTLFYTNIPTVDDAIWPRAPWYEPDRSGPLRVYVYDKQRSEIPPTWNRTADPRDGSTLVNGWFTTIEGFNEALKGHSSSAPKVVVIPPEKAYTLRGNERHPLYGDTLVFWIRILDVVDVPCRPEAPPLPCDLP